MRTAGKIEKQGEDAERFRPWAVESPLVRGLIGGGISLIDPGPPPRGLKIKREAGGGFRLRIGWWPLSLDLRLTRERLVLSGILRRRALALSGLTGIEEWKHGLLFKGPGDPFLFALPDPQIRGWLRAFIMRNLVTMGDTKL